MLSVLNVCLLTVESAASLLLIGHYLEFRHLAPELYGPEGLCQMLQAFPGTKDTP